MTERYRLEFPGRALAETDGGHSTDATWAGEPPGLDEDLFVVGDNLEVLKLLAKTHGGRVQAIYIDPPYNRRADFVYDDDFTVRPEHAPHDDERTRHMTEGGARHGPWLRMMYPRLMAARALLQDNGVIFVSLDDHETHNLRLVMDEIFGPDCFVAQVSVVSNRGGRDYLRIAVSHEYVVVYGRTPGAVIREVARTPASRVFEDDRGPFELRELRNRNPRFTPANRPNLFYPIHVDTARMDEWGVAPVSLDSGADSVMVEPRNSRGEGSVWRWSRDKVACALAGDARSSDVVARRRRDGGINIYEKLRKQTTKVRSVWDDPEVRSEMGTRALRQVMGNAVFDHPKPVELVRRCVEIGSDPGGIVLDFFAGSGTTAQAVHEQNARDGGDRRCILVQRPEPTPEGSAAHEAGYRSLDEVGVARWKMVAGEVFRVLRVNR